MTRHVVTGTAELTPLLASRLGVNFLLMQSRWYWRRDSFARSKVATIVLSTTFAKRGLVEGLFCHISAERLVDIGTMPSLREMFLRMFRKTPILGINRLN
jgi:hypothetical protein